MHDEINERIDTLNKAVFGDRENPKATPGIISELAQMNVTLLELRDAMRRLNWMIILAFVSALCAVVFKGLSG